MIQFMVILYFLSLSSGIWYVFINVQNIDTRKHRFSAAKAAQERQMSVRLSVSPSVHDKIK